MLLQESPLQKLEHNLTEGLKSRKTKKTLIYNPRSRAQEFFLDAATRHAAQHVTSELSVQQLTIFFR